MQLLRSPGVGMTMYIYGHIMVLAFAFTAITPVFYFTEVESGGFGLDPAGSALFVSNNC
jgi:hypothetical protein